jgi:hypothetical protein
MAEITNDNHPVPALAPVREPDAHGQAAMLLVESLIHGLIARSVISAEEAVEIVDTAAEVKAEVAADLGDSPETMRGSLALLEAISRSLKGDSPQG